MVFPGNIHNKRKTSQKLSEPMHNCAVDEEHNDNSMNGATSPYSTQTSFNRKYHL